MSPAFNAGSLARKPHPWDAVGNVILNDGDHDPRPPNARPTESAGSTPIGWPPCRRSTVRGRCGVWVRASANLLQALAVSLKPCIECRRYLRQLLRLDKLRFPGIGKCRPLHSMPADCADEVPNHIHTDHVSCGDWPWGPARIHGLPVSVRTLAAKEQLTETLRLSSPAVQPGRLKTTALGGSRPPLLPRLAVFLLN